MSTNLPNPHDPALRAVLREWQVTTPLPPRFQAQVWNRIERAAAPAAAADSPWALLTNWLMPLLPRPALAVAYVTGMLALGATVGWAQARQETARVGDALSARYLRAVDPYQPGR
jgi:hypothetical protein